jgi:hypothetical protein
MHPLLRKILGAPLRAKLRRQAASFVAQTPRCRETQRDVLQGLLRLNAASDFGRRHGFDKIRTVDDFRRQVPVSDYDYFRPYIERLKQGDHAALLGPQNRLLMFALTSGTTSDSKFIPITQRFLDDYRRGWKTWGIRAYDDHPQLHIQDIVQLTSDYDQFRTPGGHPCGNISGLASAVQSPIVKRMYMVPDLVSKIKDPKAKYYTALRLSIPNRRVGLVMTANPSTLIHMAKLADERRADLLRDIADGSLSSRFDIPAEIRRALAPRYRHRDPARAYELEQVVNANGRLTPAGIWPDLSLVAVWTGGSAAAYLNSLRSWFGDTPVRDHGLSASEGRMTIPFHDLRPEGLLDTISHFFEFIPEAEYENEHPTVLEAHELEAGKNYYILLTTASGLCRYNIRDVVRCAGFEGTTPLLEFLNKGAHISSLTGEKISESQVVAALRLALADVGLDLTYYTVAPQWGDPPGYRLLIEAAELPSPAVAAALETSADRRLQELNCEYAEKRRTGRLAPLSHLPLAAGTWQAFTRQRQSKLGGSIEQYKHPCLVPDLKFCETLLAQPPVRTAALAADA